MNCKGKKKLGKLFNFVRHRQYDFDNNRPYDTELNKRDIITKTYTILNDFIK
jgi:hypothetical protein